MIVRTSNYMIVDGKVNGSGDVYWNQEWFPEWAATRTFMHSPDQKRGYGPEPHYHDMDEFWLFITEGQGEAWLDGVTFDLIHNTVVYTPMGVVHRFQMFAGFGTASIITRLERQKRPTHILVEQDGPPIPTIPGFVIPGGSNTGPFRDRGPRCPLSELRLVTFAAGEGLGESELSLNEHWLVVDGALQLAVNGLEVELSPGDLALLRAGAVRRIGSDEGGQVALARE